MMGRNIVFVPFQNPITATTLQNLPPLPGDMDTLTCDCSVS